MYSGLYCLMSLQFDALEYEDAKSCASGALTGKWYGSLDLASKFENSFKNYCVFLVWTSFIDFGKKSSLKLKTQLFEKELSLGNVHKGRPIFLRFFEIPTYLCPIHYVLSIYVLSPIFLDIPTYPKIGHPLWMFPKSVGL